MPRVNQGQKVYHALEYALHILEDIEDDAHDIGVDDEDWDTMKTNLRCAQSEAYAQWKADDEANSA